MPPLITAPPPLPTQRAAGFLFSCQPRGGSNSFCTFPFANSFGLRPSHFLLLLFSFFAFICPLLLALSLSLSLCEFCNFLFTLFVASCFCYLNMPQYLAWQRQAQRQQNRYICVYICIYTIYLSICASSKDLLVTANNSVGFYVLCSHISPSPSPCLSVSLFVALFACGFCMFFMELIKTLLSFVAQKGGGGHLWAATRHKMHN